MFNCSTSVLINTYSSQKKRTEYSEYAVSAFGKVVREVVWFPGMRSMQLTGLQASPIHRTALILMRNHNTQSCCKITMTGKQLMRLSWCRERAISPCRPLRRERARQQTRRVRRQSSHWLQRFKRQIWKMPGLIRQIRSNERVRDYKGEKAGKRRWCLFSWNLVEILIHLSLTDGGGGSYSFGSTRIPKFLWVHIQFVLSVIWEVSFDLCIHPIMHLNVNAMWGAVSRHHFEFFFFCFLPGRLSPIISTFHVCKAGAPWGILCPVHPLLCWGLCSSWHLAPPVQPLCRCQLPCTCPRPLLQPVYQPGPYSRYSFIYKATHPDQNQGRPIQLADFNH